MSEEQKVVVFMDSVSRTIAGGLVSEDDDTFTVSNPVIINAMPTQQGQMSLQLIPVFFREILEDQNKPVEFTYNKGQVTMSSVDALEPNILTEYNKLFTPVAKLAPTAIETPEDEEKVILFPTEDQNNG